MNISVKAFSTKNNINLAKNYYDSHITILEKLNLKKHYHSANDNWLKNDNVYGIVVMVNNKIYGGARIECFENSEKLPIHELINKDKSNVTEYISSLKKFDYGEIVGVWKNPIAKKYGISTKLIMRSIFNFMKHIPLDYVFGLSSNQIFKPLDDLGARKVESLGENGIFYYTERKIKAAIYYFELSKSVEFARPEEKEIFKKLDNNKELIINENYKKNEIIVNYNFEF